MSTAATQVVSFSGIDGAGKSTQINALERALRDLGLSYTIYTFWDNVAAFSRLREFISYRVFRGDMGVGSPDKPIRRRDKNVTSGHVAAGRLLLYFCDAISLRLTYYKISRAKSDFVIFDRYIFDELANLPLKSSAMRFYVRMLLKLVPRPDIAFLVDGDPDAAYLRKPEYPLEFVRRNRNAYLELSQQVGEMVILPPLSPAETTASMMEAISATCLRPAAARSWNQLCMEKPEVPA